MLLLLLYNHAFFLIQRINANKREGVNNFIPEEERFSPKLAFLQRLESSSWVALLESFFIYYYYYDNLLLSPFIMRFILLIFLIIMNLF
jgi:hypothetical protein